MKLADNLDNMSRRYIRKAECKALLDQSARAIRAANAIYEAAHWTADRPVDEVALWTELRDALGREPGKSP
jgi:hypothetical protein